MISLCEMIQISTSRAFRGFINFRSFIFKFSSQFFDLTIKLLLLSPFIVILDLNVLEVCLSSASAELEVDGMSLA